MTICSRFFVEGSHEHVSSAKASGATRRRRVLLSTTDTLRVVRSAICVAAILGVAMMAGCANKEPRAEAAATPVTPAAGPGDKTVDGSGAVIAVYQNASGEALFAERLPATSGRIVRDALVIPVTFPCTPPRPFTCSIGGQSWCSPVHC